MIYQAVGYKQETLAAVRAGGKGISRPSERFVPKRRGDRTTSFNVAAAQADWLAQEHPDLIWNVETVGASQQVRR